MHPLLRQQLVRSGLDPDSVPDPAFKRFLSELEDHFAQQPPEKNTGANNSSPEMLQAVIDAIPGYVSWISSDLCYLGVNQTLADLLELKCNEVIGRRVGFTGLNDAFLAFIKDFFASDKLSDSSVLQVVNPATEQAVWHSFVARKFDGQRNAVVVGFNVDDIKKKEDTIELQQGQLLANAKMAELGQLAAAIAHEINNPLGVILGNCQILKRNLSGSKLEADRCFTLAEKAEIMAVRIGKIMRGCLSFARDAKNDPFVLTPLCQIVEESMELVVGRCEQTGVTLEVDDVPQELTLDCRPTQISQVFVNLCNNAIDAISEEEIKWLRIKISVTEENIEIRFIDSGKGVPEAIRNKIFSAFFTTKQANNGTGLGLSIAAGILKEHQGRIELEKGSNHTTFLVQLPRPL